MANLLADPNNWQSYAAFTGGGYIGPPSAFWDAATNSYFYYGDAYSIQETEMRLVASVAPGDVFEGDFEALTTSPYGVPSLKLYTEDGATVLGTVEGIVGTRVAFSFAAVTGGRLATALVGAFEYAGEARIYVVGVEPPPPPPPPPPPDTCKEIGRATRAYVSAHQRDRVHYSSIVRGERRCLVADFNGALPPGRTIASAIWRCDQPFAVAMETARIFENDRSSAVDITGQYGRGARIKCQVTLDNGEVYNQLFIVRVKNFPWFQGETPPMSGPYDLVVSKQP